MVFGFFLFYQAKIDLLPLNEIFCFCVTLNLCVFFFVLIGKPNWKYVLKFKITLTNVLSVFKSYQTLTGILSRFSTESVIVFFSILTQWTFIGRMFVELITFDHLFNDKIPYKSIAPALKPNHTHLITKNSISRREMSPVCGLFKRNPNWIFTECKTTATHTTRCWNAKNWNERFFVSLPTIKHWLQILFAAHALTLVYIIDSLRSIELGMVCIEKHIWRKRKRKKKNNKLKAELKHEKMTNEGNRSNDNGGDGGGGGGGGADDGWKHYTLTHKWFWFVCDNRRVGEPLTRFSLFLDSLI